MRSEILFEKAMEHIQSPSTAHHLAELVVTELSKIEGFDALPKPLRQAIEQRAAQLYSAGFVLGARWNAA